MTREPTSNESAEDSEPPEVVDQVFDSLAVNHPQISYNMDPPGAQFKREMVEKYMKAAPYMYKVSNPPQVFDCSQGSQADQEKNVVCNEPKVNEWMVQEGKNKI